MPTRATLLSVVLAVPLLAQDPPEIRKGRWTPDKVPVGWVVHSTAHYQIQSQAGMDKAKRLATHLEAMLVLYRRMFPPDKELDRFPVKLFKGRKEFRAYGAPATAAAYYSPTAKELVAYDTGKWSDEAATPRPATTGEGAESKESDESRIRRLRERFQMDILGVIAHEAWHQYFHHHIVSLVEFPAWIDEGLGDWFYTARPQKQRGVVKAELGQVNEVRLPAIQWAIKNNRHTRLKSLLRFRQADYYADAGVHYAQGWSLCHFLLGHKDPRYNQVVKTLIARFKISGKMDDATEAAFRGIDLEKLEEEWKAHVLALKLGS